MIQALISRRIKKAINQEVLSGMSYDRFRIPDKMGYCQRIIQR